MQLGPDEEISRRRFCFVASYFLDKITRPFHSARGTDVLGHAFGPSQVNPIAEHLFDPGSNQRRTDTRERNDFPRSHPAYTMRYRRMMFSKDKPKGFDKSKE